MTIHTTRLDIITTIEQHRSDTIIITDRRHLTIRIMAIAIRLTINIAPIAINRSDHLIRSVIMGHLISIAHLLTEVVDKKSNEI